MKKNILYVVFIAAFFFVVSHAKAQIINPPLVINGAKINNSPIGQTTPSSIAATSFTATSSNIGGGVSTGSVFKAHAAANSNIEILTPNSGSGIRVFSRDDSGTPNRLELQGGSVIFPLNTGADGLVFDAATGDLTSTASIISSSLIASSFAKFNGIAGTIYVGRASDLVSGGSADDIALRSDTGSIIFSRNSTESGRINAIGNFGLGTIPSAWGTSSKAMQIGSTAGAALSADGDDSSFATNAYRDGATWYAQTSSTYAPTLYNQFLGSHIWSVASGSATSGSAITWTQAMKLDNVRLDTTGPIRASHGYIVSSLPAGTIGDRAYVTDSTACTFLGALTGGGSTFCPVIFNGSSWVGG